MDDNVKIVQAQSEVTALLTREFIANRNLLLYGEINEQTANDMLMLLTKMSAEDPSAPINLYINSPGGDVQAGLTIVDVMNSLKCPVNTICYSLAASMAAVILAAGDKRYALKHATIMIHQPLVGAQGWLKNDDVNAMAERSNRIRRTVEEILAESTKGKTSLEAMHEACSRDHFLTSEEALEMGLIDEILGQNPKI